MTWLLFLAILTGSCSVKSTFVWNDCSTAAKPAFTVHAFYLDPDPVVNIESLHVYLRLTINRPIDHLFIDVEMGTMALSNNPIGIPCFPGTNIGSCQSIDACSIPADIWTNTSISVGDVVKQIQFLLLSALDSKHLCPVMPANDILTSKTILLAKSSYTDSISDGNYHTKIIFKDNPVSSDDVGCLEYDFVFKRSHTGFLFK